MRVEQIPEFGRHYDIFDGNKIVATIMHDERLAYQFALSGKMLSVCRKLVELESRANTDGDMDWDLLAEVTALARNVVERVEGEWECSKK